MEYRDGELYVGGERAEPRPEGLAEDAPTRPSAEPTEAPAHAGPKNS
jgi:hypothetical protein